LALLIPGCRSLKEKRGIVRRLKDRTFNRFKVPVAEVGFQDKWQRSELGFSVSGNDRRIVEGIIQKMTDFIEALGLVQIIDVYNEIINV